MTATTASSTSMTAALLEWGRETLKCEAEVLGLAALRLNETFALAAQAMGRTRGKVVVTGLGKSGHIGRKVASTLSSLGTSAFFLHPTEALHGDFGTIQSDDCLLAIAFGGETLEVLEVARFARRVGIPVVAITGNATSTLANLADFVIDGRVDKEADPLGLAPTCSSTVALALGDAFAVAIMRARGFTQGDFASLHPGGSLGRRLSRVVDHMQTGDKIPKITEDTGFHEALECVTRHNFGIAAVVDREGRLIGAISDGDVRRALLKAGAKALSNAAAELMTLGPKTIAADALALDALKFMNDHRITQLFVIDEGKLVGIVRLHDLLAAKIL